MDERTEERIGDIEEWARTVEHILFPFLLAGRAVSFGGVYRGGEWLTRGGLGRVVEVKQGKRLHERDPSWFVVVRTADGEVTLPVSEIRPAFEDRPCA